MVEMIHDSGGILVGVAGVFGCTGGRSFTLDICRIAFEYCPLLLKKLFISLYARRITFLRLPPVPMASVAGIRRHGFGILPEIFQT